MTKLLMLNDGKLANANIFPAVVSLPREIASVNSSCKAFSVTFG